MTTHPDSSEHYTHQLDELIAAILAALPKNVSALTRHFVQQYYAKMPIFELMRFQPEEACRIALNSLPFFQEKNERVKIRSFRPQKAALPWDGEYYCIEVLNDDHAFIYDSMRAELTRQGYRFNAIVHPVLFLRRDKNGQLIEMVNIDDEGDLPRGAKAESFIHYQLIGQVSEEDAARLEQDLRRILASVELVVDDFHAMQKKADETIRDLSKSYKFFDTEEVTETRDFMQWLLAKHFVFLGYMEYVFERPDGDISPRVIPQSELGIFKIADESIKPKALSALPSEIVKQAVSHEMIEITKSSRRSIVHRPVLMDYITIRRFDAKGEVIGERRFLGMFTSTVYYQSADHIPFIRRKIARTLARANYDPMGHNGKALKAILEFYPRDELFQISEADLFHFSIGLIALEAKPEARLFVRTDRYERFVSCMVYIPKERFSSYLREKIVSILERNFHGKVRDFFTQLTESPVARVHLILETTPGQIPPVDMVQIEKQIANITNQWADSLRDALQHEPDAQLLLPMFADAFPDAYLEYHDAPRAVHDIRKIHECAAQDGFAADLYWQSAADQLRYHVSLYGYPAERALSDMLPMLENMGCRVQEVVPFLITPKWDKGDILIRDFTIIPPALDTDLLQARKPLFEEALRQIWHGHTANDGLNQLVLLAGLSHREVEILRSLSHYLRQILFPYSNHYVADAFARHPQAAQLLIAFFHARFDPAKNPAHDRQAAEEHLNALEDYLNQVSNLAEDRIIRRFMELVQAMLRTNAYQMDASGQPKSYFSFKFASTHIPELPKPVPFAEIFVYSMRCEGIHLRGDSVARGGLRWSDRPEDFRTEVLGLVKAQIVKNAVIVPHGAKGGFVLKQSPKDGTREAIQQEAIACYRQFLSGLLDITDNIIAGEVVPPPQTVRLDGDDPYLVVAADKGTATFSDIANGVAKDYGFWLGDAFASGGSVGYDHKAMGITARGAWVSVERHFREAGINIREQDFTVAGIGDMSGDVFGNGMLLSDHIQLVAAFNHRHIFIDPTPNAKQSFKERQRLFALPGSQWSDYDTKKISKGGGIYARDAKTIELSKEAMKALDIKKSKLSPDALIQAILCAPVDLLWNGGIGTYIKASDETHADVGDRANNAVRVNAADLRCKIIGEGGNLGLTQRGRIEYALKGGRLNTDAIDNSAGVDCSDHEVNIKIAFSDALGNGQLSLEKRNALLADMTDDVAALVLIDNHLQTQAISNAQHLGLAMIEPLSRMMQELEQQDFLDRQVEFLPTDKQIAERRAHGEGFTRPELSVLLSYAKLSLYRELRASQMASSDYFIADLLRYFPKAMQAPFREAILSHRLRREIVATMITNSIINRAGISFAHRLLQETGVHPCDLARSYIITRDAFRLREIWRDIEALEHQVDATTQTDMLLMVQQFIDESTRWFLRECPDPIDMDAVMATYAAPLQTLMEDFESLLSKSMKTQFTNHRQEWIERGVPEALARRIASLEVMKSAGDIVKIAHEQKCDLSKAGRIYFEIGAQLKLGLLRRKASRISSDAYWEQLAIQSVIRELYAQQRRLSALASHTDCTSADDFMRIHEKSINRYMRLVDDIRSQESLSLSMLVLIIRQLEQVAG